MNTSTSATSRRFTSAFVQAGNMRATSIDDQTGGKLYKCALCEYTSVWKHSLRIHLRIHSGEKSFKCNLCNYAFVLVGNLRRHLKTHCGEKSYKCNQAVRLCLCLGSCFEGTCENSQRKETI